jgi:hypothetical protein
MTYQLIIKIPFEALDDVQAREKAKGMLEDIVCKEDAEIKLQTVHIDKPPVGIPL